MSIRQIKTYLTLLSQADLDNLSERETNDVVTEFLGTVDLEKLSKSVDSQISKIMERYVCSTEVEDIEDVKLEWLKLCLLKHRLEC